MNRTRPAAWMLIVALSLPAAPLLFGAQAEDRAAEDASADERTGTRRAERAGDSDTTDPRRADDADATEPRRTEEAEVAKPTEPRRTAEVENPETAEPRRARNNAAGRPAAKGQAGRAASRPAARAKQKPARKGGADPAAPATRPAGDLSAEELLSQMLKPPAAGGNRPLRPLPEAAAGGADKKSGAGAVAPAAPVVNVLREGTFLVDRVGRIQRNADGSAAEFVFEADGTALQDPPVVIVPNLKLMQMEDAAANSTRDLRFRVSGMVTEYRGRNYVLLEKVVVVPDVLEKF